MIEMLNVQRMASTPMGIPNMVHFNEYLFPSSPPMINFIPQIDILSGKLFGRTTTPIYERNDETIHKRVVKPQKAEPSPKAPQTCLRRVGEQIIKNSKKVSFADDVGKQLIEVWTFSTPNHLFDDFRSICKGTKVNGKQSIFDICPSLNASKLNIARPSYKPDFVQPVTNFVSVAEKVEQNRLSLEYANLTTDEKTRIPTLSGKILAKNQGVNRVFLRCTINGWKTHADVEAKRVAVKFAGGYETFNFSIDLFKLCHLTQGEDQSQINNKYPESVEFAVCCQSSDEHWDNNSGSNYIFARQHT